MNKYLGDLHAAIAENPNNAESRFKRGVAFYVKGDLLNAITDFVTCISLGKTNLALYFFLGTPQPVFLLILSRSNLQPH